ncbi:hypothetical protein D3C75_1254800 [compost metagenome]
MDFQNVRTDAGDLAAHTDAHARRIFGLSQANVEYADQSDDGNPANQLTKLHLHGTALRR